LFRSVGSRCVLGVFSWRPCFSLRGLEVLELIKFEYFARATEAMADGGTLTISTQENEHQTTIEVSDTGIGIPENEMENLFKPFYTTKPKGVGLGLTYCKRTVEAHRGTIEAESKTGEGTKITITLPKTQ